MYIKTRHFTTIDRIVNMARPTEAPPWAPPEPRYRVLWPADLGQVASRQRPSARLAALFDFRDNAHLHLVRLNDMLGGKHSTTNELFKRFNIKTELGNIAPKFTKNVEYLQQFPVYPAVPAVPGDSARAPGGVGRVSSGVGSSGHTHGVSAAPVWGGWACGAVILALLVLLVRAAEKCVDKRLFHSRRRRQSEEWPAANVRATSLQQQNDLGSLTFLDGSEFSTPTQRNSDLPPPYSECASNNNIVQNNNAKTSNKANSEEPPPPYSECLVAFSNKDIPTVHIHGRSIDEAHTSSDIDVVQNLIEHQHGVNAEQSTYEEECMRVELVFDNGRIIERTIDIDRVDVPDIIATVGDTVIGNEIDSNLRFVDDSVAENENQDRIVFV